MLSLTLDVLWWRGAKQSSSAYGFRSRELGVVWIAGEQFFTNAIHSKTKSLGDLIHSLLFWLCICTTPPIGISSQEIVVKVLCVSVGLLDLSSMECFVLIRMSMKSSCGMLWWLLNLSQAHHPSCFKCHNSLEQDTILISWWGGDLSVLKVWSYILLMNDSSVNSDFITEKIWENLIKCCAPLPLCCSFLFDLLLFQLPEDSGRHSDRGVTSTRATPLDQDSSHVQASEGRTVYHFIRDTQSFCLHNSYSKMHFLFEFVKKYMFRITEWIHRDRDCSHICSCWSISLEPLSCLSDVEMLGRSRESVSDRPQTASEASGRSSLDAVVTLETEVSVSEENMTRMENLLDMWGDNLKVDIFKYRILIHLMFF